VGLLEDIFHLGDGIKSGIEDARGLVKDLAHGDVHGAVGDLRKLFGDTGSVLQGMEGLGMGLGPLPAWYGASAFAKLADSEILSAAQLVIKGERMLTGSGEPEDGEGYRDSAKRLTGVVETLIDADPASDRWDGAASDAYKSANDKHRRHASDLQVADERIAQILSTEAEQVSQTRKDLDDTSQDLYDFGTATSWMNFVPPLIPVKIMMDLAAAASALGAANITTEKMVANAVQNAMDCRGVMDKYATAAGDKSGDGGTCGPFVPPDQDWAHLPTRLQPNAPYTVPTPEHPNGGSPATPYSSGGQAPLSAPAPAPAPAVAAPAGWDHITAPIALATPSSYRAASSYSAPPPASPTHRWAASSPQAPTAGTTPAPAMPSGRLAPQPSAPSSASTASAPAGANTAAASVTDGAGPASAGRQRAPVEAGSGGGPPTSFAHSRTPADVNGDEQPPKEQR